MEFLNFTSKELDEKEGLDDLDLDWNNIHCTSFEEVYGPMDLREEESIMVDLIGDETSYNETELNDMIQEMIQQVEQNQKKKSFSKRPRKVKPNYNIRSVNGTLKEVCETKDSREKAVCSEDKTIEGVDLLGDEISCDSSKFNDMIQEMKSNTEAKKVGQNRKKKRSKPTMKPKPNCKIPSMKKALEKVNESKNSRTEAMSDDDETIEVVDLLGDETSDNNSELKDKSQETKQKVEQNQKKEWLQKPSKKFYPNPNTLAVNKALREKGKPYLGRTKDGTMVQRPARMLGPACVAVECTQRQRYCRSITQDERQQIFSWCWNELNWPQRRQYVCSLVKRTSAVSMLRKSAVLAYQLEVGDKLVPVCKSMFLNTLGVTGREMMWWTQEKPESSMAKVG